MNDESQRKIIKSFCYACGNEKEIEAENVERYWKILSIKFWPEKEIGNIKSHWKYSLKNLKDTQIESKLQTCMVALHEIQDFCGIELLEGFYFSYLESVNNIYQAIQLIWMGFYKTGFISLRSGYEMMLIYLFWKLHQELRFSKNDTEKKIHKKYETREIIVKKYKKWLFGNLKTENYKEYFRLIKEHKEFKEFDAKFHLLVEIKTIYGKD